MRASVQLRKAVVLCAILLPVFVFIMDPSAYGTGKVRGIINFAQVDSSLYRGSQPSAEGFEELEKMGIRSIVNLRNHHSDDDEAEGANLKLYRIPLDPWSIQQQDVIQFLKIATDMKNQPVFVHCQHGVDRTGTMVAAYRVVVQDWSKERAVQELNSMGKHKLWGNLEGVIRDLNVEEIRSELGIHVRK